MHDRDQRLTVTRVSSAGGHVQASQAGRLLNRCGARVESLAEIRLSDRALHRLVLGAVLGAGTALRLWQINALGLNSDEAVYAGQAAALAGDPVLSGMFPIFRAHPLLYQSALALVLRLGVSDLLGRLLGVAVGVATIYVVYRLGDELYGHTVGLLSAWFLALMPYHVVVTRQILLDGPMTLFATLTLYLLARLSKSRHPAWLYGAGAAMGLTILAKETGIVLLASIYIYLALSPELRTRLRDVALSIACMALIVAPFPLSLLLAGGGSAISGRQYLIWQLFRRPNHDWDFYLTTVPEAIGPLLIAAALLGLWLLRAQNTWRERLLLAWAVVPVAYFQLWPVKGFQYLLPLAPVVAVLGARTLVRWAPQAGVGATEGRPGWVSAWALAGPVVAVSLLVASWARVEPAPTAVFLAGSGGVAGGREAGVWVRDHVPQGGTLMTIGPSMANILQFYGHHKAYGLSVSPNPLHRNPSYQPIHNPDLQIRNGEIQYVVWDAYSAARSAFFSQKLRTYAQRYHGRVVHTESIDIATPGGEVISRPLIIVYQVRP